MAKKKNAPVLKNNLRNEPAEKFRTVNRMNGIVTMIEYTSEDDIKAYELEPTYRELTGGGGGGDYHTATLRVTNNTASDGQYFTPELLSSEGHTGIMIEHQIHSNETQEIQVIYTGVGCELSFLFTGTLSYTINGSIMESIPGVYWINGDCSVVADA